VSPASNQDPEAAWREALRLLGVRPLTVLELRERLADRGHAPETVEACVQRAESAGYLQDGELAWNYIVARGARLGHGPRRMIEDLVRRGVARKTAEAAWARAVEQGDLDGELLLGRALDRRLGPGSADLDPRRRRRVYNALLRAGFEPSAVYRAMLARCGSGEGFDDDVV